MCHNRKHAKQIAFTRFDGETRLNHRAAFRSFRFIANACRRDSRLLLNVRLRKGRLASCPFPVSFTSSFMNACAFLYVCARTLLSVLFCLSALIVGSCLLEAGVCSFSIRDRLPGASFRIKY